MAGMTPEGFVRKTKEEILASLRTRQASLVDPGLNTSATGVIENLNETFAEELAQCWEAAQEIWDAHDPNAATDIAADHNGALSGLIRENKSKATVTLRLMLDPYTTVVAGSVASVPGNPTARFVTLVDAITAGSGGTIDVAAEAETAGALSVGANQITQIESPTSGWTAVTNPAAATAGTDVETDEAYRQHRAEVIASQGGSTVAGVVADVRKIATVSEANVIENYTDATVDGLPPKSFEIVLVSSGGDDDVIAQSIWNNKPAGIEPVGSSSGTAVDDDGVEHIVPFTRATQVRVNVNYQVTADGTYPSNGVPAALIAAAANPTSTARFRIGGSVDVGELISAARNSQGVLLLTLDIAKHPTVPADPIPTSPAFSLTFTAREIPYFDALNSFTETP